MHLSSKRNAEAEGGKSDHTHAAAATGATPPSAVADPRRPWRTKDPERRLPLFKHMASGGSVSPAYVPMPTITGERKRVRNVRFILGMSGVAFDGAVVVPRRRTSELYEQQGRASTLQSMTTSPSPLTPHSGNSRSLLRSRHVCLCTKACRSLDILSPRAIVLRQETNCCSHRCKQ